MSEDCGNLIESYITWLSNRIELEDVKGVCQITTPFLDRHNDHLQIYVTRIGDKIRLSDDSYTLADLEMSGFSMTPRRKQTLESILRGFAVEMDGNELSVIADKKDFPQRKHGLIQAMLAVDDMFMISTPSVAQYFKDDVEKFLKENKIRYVKDASFTGTSGFTHQFHFVIPASPDHSQRYPERYLNAISNPTRQHIIARMIFPWNDVEKVRHEESVAYAVLNDMDKDVSNEVTIALSQYGIKPFFWKKREQCLPELIS